jgi:hypothetical protein
MPYPESMSYPDQVNYVYSLMHRKPLEENNVTLVADYTGFGRPVFDMLQRKGINAIGLSIHGGDNASWSKDKRVVKVPKRDLVSILQVYAQDGRLRVARGLQFGPVLGQELQNFRVKINERNGHDSYSAREGKHDDLLLSVAISLWCSENQPARKVTCRLVDAGGSR